MGWDGTRDIAMYRRSITELSGANSWQNVRAVLSEEKLLVFSFAGRRFPFARESAARVPRDARGQGAFPGRGGKEVCMPSSCLLLSMMLTSLVEFHVPSLCACFFLFG